MPHAIPARLGRGGGAIASIGHIDSALFVCLALVRDRSIRACEICSIGRRLRMLVGKVTFALGSDDSRRMRTAVPHKALLKHQTSKINT